MDIKAPSASNSIYDLASLDKLRKDALNNEKGALRKAAQQFETIFLSMMLKSMRDANQYFEADSPMNSQYAKFYRDMHDQQMVQDLAHQNVLGIADLIVEQLAPDYERVIPASMLVGQRGSEHLQPLTNDNTLTPAGIAVEQPIPTLVDTKFPQPDRAAALKLQFVAELLPAAQQAATSLGVDPHVLVAQAAKETDWGRQLPTTATGQSSFNWFQLPATNTWTGATLQSNMQVIQAGQFQRQPKLIRAYDSAEAGLSDYAAWLKSKPQYQAALEQASDSNQFLQALQQGGWSKDPHYAASVMHHLAQILNIKP
jgi:peptidoglycan hydrolase FlgJ